MTEPLAFNKLCEIEDFAHPELAPVIRDVCRHKIAHFPAEFPRGTEHRKDWETAMAVRALDHFGALHRDARILGVAVGMEDTIFYLTGRVGQVFATDRYYGAGDWGTVAPGLMLVEPQEASRSDFEVNRLVVQHMDGRSLRYPDGTFDGIFSSGSIEHFGELMDAAHAAYEMGRVLKPGGILSLSTEFKLSGPPDGIGWPGRTLLFSTENLIRYIVEASGLELVDELVPRVSQATLAAPRDLDQVILERISLPKDAGPECTMWDWPHLILVKDDFVFGSVHLTLRKTDRHPVAANEWARPPASVLESISAYNRSVAAPPREPAAPPAVPEQAPAAARSNPAPADLARIELMTHSHAAQAAGVLSEVDGLLRNIDRSRDETDARLSELARLRAGLEERLGQSDLAPARAADGNGHGRSSVHEVILPQGPTFTAVLDSPPGDPVSQMLALPHGLDHHHTLRLMLEMLEPGRRVVDLGAHVGTFSLAAAAIGCQVIAVEASPSNASLLRSSAWHNGFHHLRVINAAVADAPGTLQFLSDGPHGHVAWGETGDALTVPAITVDEILAELGWDGAAFVKIDIEGSETKALVGMRRLLGGPDAPPVLFESNGHTLELAGTSPRELFAGFEALGYVIYVVDPGRLTRIGSGDMQAETVIDCLAVKRRPPGLDGWIVVPSMTLEDCVRRVLTEAGHHNPDCRAWVARTLAAAAPAVATHPEVVGALDRLRRDPVPEVAKAAAWSDPGLRTEAEAT